MAAMSDPVIRLQKLGFTWQTRDPFLFCVHHDDKYPAGNEIMGPAASLAGRDIGQDFEGIDGWRMYHGERIPGFPAHPHRGFETVTVVRKGLVDHADSLGAAARYGHGDVQWLTAGKGIQHSEMMPLVDRERPNPLELFQIWLNLPGKDKLATPNFSMFWEADIPRISARDQAGKATEIAVIAGRIGDTAPLAPPPRSWASQPGSDVAIWTIAMEPGARWTVPAAAKGTNRTLYFFEGTKLRIDGRDIPAYHGVDVRPDVALGLENGPDAAQILVLQGKPIGEPVAQHGPFVMNSPQEIRQAFLDYQRDQFGGWPWETSAPVHPREEPRFARYTDGRVERQVK
jgi:redox-sensitive bicupin YhaK (pirin superfamily)